MTTDFSWRDAGRTVVFRRGGVARAVELLRENGVEEFELLSTERALGEARDDLVEAAQGVHFVASGQVPAAAGALTGALAPPSDAEEGVRVRPLVAFGGGRVIDVAKAVASVSGAEVIAIPTTLSGAPMTAIHRLPAGDEERVRGMVRPSLVIADPEAMTGQPERELRASAMNALAHGADTLYSPLSNPVSEMTALRGAELISRALDEEREGRDRAALALGSILCGYAIDSAGLGLHHVVCQTLVRVCGTPHAETNAAVLPHALEFLVERAPEPYGRLASALGTDLKGLGPRVKRLGQPQPLGDLGGDASKRDEALDAMLQRSELGRVPGPPVTREDLERLVRKAWA
ncbi:MAG TPA: iron-containing alcohol dehydrogenase [Solirubrobacterales bacterium]|nr:iron-containing alcohol dehydrogenase [Solirubrobacterales bacterium]